MISKSIRFKHWLRSLIRLFLSSKSCKSCGFQLVKVRGRFPYKDNREVCAQCNAEELDIFKQRDQMQKHSEDNQVRKNKIY